ncbi:MAG: 16S rRNA (guanine(966)-N(2))-methyltransferase RsmD [Dokdonella sp.]|uniref:16S rRNA (guanine(966)-N(2))-methyltransferase RsmD n=1 Tax=Dokdonella sp. TaxID=2291710 RepID=UPI003F7D92E3
MRKPRSSRSGATKASAGAVRIVAGRLRGSRLAVPVREGLRPTPDRVRETLFNWLMPYLPGMRCLDLYAGTGALGIEALSRGATTCTFVERDRELARALADNLVRLRVEGAEVVNADAATWLAGPARTYDLVFLDPPFEADLWQGAAAALESRGWLADGGFAYVESPRDAPLQLPAAWTPHREGHAGAVRHALYRRSGSVPLS